MRKDIDLLCIGDAVLDIYLNIDSFPLKADKIVSSERTSFVPGGMCTVAITASRMGLRTALFDFLGKDPAGSLLLSVLRKEGVATEGIVSSSGRHTAICAVLVSRKKEHTFVGYGGSGVPSQLLSRRLRAVLPGTRAIFFDGYFISQTARTADMMRGILEQCRKMGVTVAFDPGPLIGTIPDPGFFLTNSDIVFVNEVEHRFLRRFKSVHSSGAKGNLIVVKTGERGAYATDGIVSVRVPGVKVRRLENTVGAGDAFDAAFMWAHLGGMDLEDSLNAGNIVASRKVSSPGLSGIPSGKEVVREMRKKRYRS